VDGWVKPGHDGKVKTDASWDKTRRSKNNRNPHNGGGLIVPDCILDVFDGAVTDQSHVEADGRPVPGLINRQQ
jgi:hypothetical protein